MTQVYAFGGFAGCVSRTRSRDTGLVIGIYRNDQAGMDDDEGREPWSTVCEEHSWVVSHQTLALARAFAAAPREWCEVCSGAWVPEDDEPAELDPEPTEYPKGPDHLAWAERQQSVA